MSQASVRACSSCGIRYDGVDMVRTNWCRDCARRIGFHPSHYEDLTAYQCERCDGRRWTRSGVVLCRDCRSAARRWHELSRACTSCGSRFLPVRPSERRCRPGCGYERSMAMVHARALGTHTPHEWGLLLRQYDGQCAYCGTREEEITRDHVIPVTRGGSDAIDNILPACRCCNSSKGRRLLAEWAGPPVNRDFFDLGRVAARARPERGSATRPREQRVD